MSKSAGKKLYSIVKWNKKKAGKMIEDLENLSIKDNAPGGLPNGMQQNQSVPGGGDDSCASSANKVNCKRLDYLSWDDYFMAAALLSAKRSKDPSTQVGACIVDNEKRIVANGYNGFPRHCDDDVFPWCKRTSVDGKVDSGQSPEELLNDKLLYVVHAEANAILNRNSANIKGMTLYTTLFPCNECTKLIIQSGISKIYFMSDKYEGKPIYRASKRMLDAANIKYERFIPSKNRIVLDFEEIIKEDPTSPRKKKLNQ